ncbi:hypothetical protein PF008_g31037 [Phytophthora fragariae]|uniref:Uncharacterized protein n=1 Tax=Phytophthora fragariae TaxID=53985 RepID=A0A6G0Q4C3_9STRA|nr:hypothetical protein PF003_g39879 [Phytophthora fragariae]KAE9268785.1 hypothetical protein PF008_g31037 [Phytophthora fragariae]
MILDVVIFFELFSALSGMEPGVDSLPDRYGCPFYTHCETCLSMDPGKCVAAK